MKIAYSNICINPSFPIKQSGFIQQINPVYRFKDDLHARLVAFDDDEKIIIHISIDLIYATIELQEGLERLVQEKSSKPVRVIISATHTHFSGDIHDIRFQGELIEKLMYAIENLEYIESQDFSISYQCVPFEGVGTSRISNHKANVLLQLYTIYKNSKAMLGLIVYNCHPTIHNGDTPYFTAEYPGYVLQEMKHLHPDMEFTFLQGAAGDVSTRFTRITQDYKGMITLAMRLVNKLEELMCENPEQKPLDHVETAFEVFPIEHEFNPIDLSKVSNDLSDREKETIEIGMKVREDLSHHLYTLVKQAMISKLDLGPYTFVFCPNEAFSSYIDCVDTNSCALVAYSNGYAPYITGLQDDFITYEKFTDTYTENTKRTYMALLQKYGKK